MKWHKKHIKMWNYIYYEIDTESTLSNDCPSLGCLKIDVLEKYFHIDHIDDRSLLGDCFSCEEASKRRISAKQTITDNCICFFCPFDVHNNHTIDCMDGLWETTCYDYINWKKNKSDESKHILLNNVIKIRDFPLKIEK